MKFWFFLFSILGIASCQAQSNVKRLEWFKSHQKTFEEVVRFCKTNQTTLGMTPQVEVLFWDPHLLSNPLYQNACKDSLDVFFKTQLFHHIGFFSDGNIEFLIDWKSNPARMTETKVYYLYSPNENLPVAYSHWSQQLKLCSNWWYLEHTDGKY